MITYELSYSFPLVLLFAILAAVDFMLGVGQNEDLFEFLLNGRDAARILAADDIVYLFQLVCNESVFYDIDCNIVIDETEDIEIDGSDGTFDFQDILFPHFIGFHIHDNGNGIVVLLEPQVMVNLQGCSRLDMIEDISLIDTTDVQHLFFLSFLEI